MELFFDSNIFLHHLAGNDKASKLMEKVEKNNIIGYINDIVISEVVYGFLRAKTGLRPLELKKNIVEIEIDLRQLRDLFKIFRVLPCNIGYDIFEVMNRYSLLPNDALIAATCRFYGIRRIATFDDDFKTVKFLRVVKV